MLPETRSGHVYDVAADNLFDFECAEYAELFSRSAATAFQHPVWLSGLYSSVAKANAAEPLILVVRSTEDGRLAMVLPMMRLRYAGLRVVEFADLRVTDYVAPVTDPETFASIAADERVGAEIQRLLQPFDLLRLNKLSDLSLPVERLFGRARRQSMGMSAYASPLATTFALWREERLDGSYRKELDKKSRKLARRGEVRFTVSEDEGGIEPVFEALKLYRGRRFDGSDGARDLLQEPAYFDFYRSVARRGLGHFARSYALWVDDVPVAAALALVHGGSCLIILSGFDEYHFKKQSVGSLLFLEIARDCIERGEKALDFTIGDEPYKLTFGAEPSPMWRVSKAGSPLGYAAKLASERMPGTLAKARRLLRGTPRVGATMNEQQGVTNSAAARVD